MFESYEKFIVGASPSLEYCDQFIVAHKLEDEVIIDHICYKCQSTEEYEHLRSLLEAGPAKYLYQVNFSKRRVAYFGLKKSIVIKTGEIKFIELSDKKAGIDEVTGFHHVEIYPLKTSYENLVGLLKQKGENPVLKERPHHTTYDITLSGGFVIRLTDKPLIKKIVEEELLNY
jgi:hypothetical protein